MATEEKPEGEAPEGGTTPETEAKPEVETPEVEEFDKDRAMATIKAQRAENKALQAKAKRADELEAAEQKRKDAELSETERLKKEKAELAAENAKIKADSLRRDVIAKTGLPDIFKDRLKGETEEELLADAEALAKTLPELKKAPKIPAKNPSSDGQTTETDLQKRERLFGGQRNIFDLESIKEKGGGVIYNDK